MYEMRRSSLYIGQARKSPGRPIRGFQMRRLTRRAATATSIAVLCTLAGTTGGAISAVASSNSGFKACAKSGVLSLLTNGKCPNGASQVTVGAQGPTGPRGPKGETGKKGAQGEPGTSLGATLFATAGSFTY